MQVWRKYWLADSNVQVESAWTDLEGDARARRAKTAESPELCRRLIVVITGIGVAVNIALDCALVGPMAHGGLALANTVSSVLITVLLVAALSTKLGGLRIGNLTLAFAKVVTVASVMSGVAYVLAVKSGLFAGEGGLAAQAIAVAVTIAAAGAGGREASRLPYFWCHITGVGLLWIRVTRLGKPNAH